MERVWKPITPELQLYMKPLEEDVHLCILLSKEENKLTRTFFSNYSVFLPLLKALRQPEYSELYILRFKGKVFALQARNKELWVYGGESYSITLSYWNYLVGEYWYPELISHFKNVNK